MTKFKFNHLKLINKLFLLAIALLGFSSCNGKEDVDEYGTPSANFIINGNIKSLNTNEIIEGIQITATGNSTYSDESGDFNFRFSGFSKDFAVELILKDIDSSLNGSFEESDTLIDFSDTEFTGGNGQWNLGTATKNIELRMKPKD